GAAEQKNRERARGRRAKLESLEHIGAAYALMDGQAEEARDPYDRHAIGRTELAVEERFAEILVRAADDQEIEIGRGDKKRGASGRRGIDPSQDSRHIGRVDRHAEDAVDLAGKIINEVGSGDRATISSIGRVDDLRARPADTLNRRLGFCK